MGEKGKPAPQIQYKTTYSSVILTLGKADREQSPLFDEMDD